MSEHIQIKKGLNLPIEGEALCNVTKSVVPDFISVKPTDFRALTPKMLVKEGEAVLAGTPLFCDKQNPDVVFASPISGTVDAVIRGDKRKLLEVKVKSDGKGESVKHQYGSISSLTADEVKKALLESGLWPCIKQRPYGIVANPNVDPKSIFISAISSAPLAADFEFTMKDEFAAVQAGIDALGKLTKGGVHFSMEAYVAPRSDYHNLKGVIFHTFQGVHPMGNVGVQINHISPINKGEVVWTVDFFLVAAIGRLFLNGVYDMSRLVAVAGPAAKNPSYVKCLPGTQMSELSEYFCDKCDVRVVSGNVLTGDAVGKEGSLGFYSDLVTILPEGDYYEMFGWAKPFRFKKFSFSRGYFSWILPKSKKYAMDTNTNGDVRAFVVSDVYGKVLPMDIYPVYLFKAILAGDIEKMEELGIYEVIEEDVALCEYVCPSKIEIQKIVSDGIDLMLKEMA